MKNEIKTKNINVCDIVLNEGQIEGLPKNPRTLKGAKFEKLKKSISENPEMLNLRELLVYPFTEPDNSVNEMKVKYIVIGGNMRFLACKDLGIEEVPCKVIPSSTPLHSLKAYVIKDNNAFGEWDFDLLANEWDLQDLKDWGLDVNFSIDEPENAQKPMQDMKVTVTIPAKVSHLYNEIFDKIEELMEDYPQCITH